jgi:hypothetical protein
MRRGGIASLLLAGLAAYGYYKYTKMSAEEKDKLMEKGKKFVDDNLGSLKNMFGQKTQNATASAGAGGYRGDGSAQG